PGWLVAAFSGAVLPDPVAVGGADRLRFVGVPSGVVARRAHGVRRPLWTRAIVVPDRRQHGAGARSVAGRRDRAEDRATGSGMVQPRGAAGDRDPVAGEPL